MRSSGRQGTWNMKMYWGGRRKGREEGGEGGGRGGRREKREKGGEDVKRKEEGGKE